MAGFLPPLAMVLATIGALLAYAGSTHQRLIPTQRPAFRWIGWALLAIALILLLSSFGTPAAIFTWITFAMLIWSVVPLVVAWRKWRKQGE